MRIAVRHMLPGVLGPMLAPLTLAVADAVMIEAVENHMPQVIVIDEIGTAAEALAGASLDGAAVSAAVVVLPVVLVLIFGVLQYLYRKRKYTR